MAANLNKSEYIVYGLRDFYAGVYSYDSETGKITYSQQAAIGHGISSTLGFRFAEGRLYSGGVLRRFKKKTDRRQHQHRRGRTDA